MTRNYHAETAASITALARRIMDTNLCKEIVFEGAYYAPYIPGYPKTSAALKKLMPKYKFSREWHVAEYDWVHYGEVMSWCAEQFGPHPRQHDAWSRWWDRYEGKVHFRDQKDYNWFVLRWGA